MRALLFLLTLAQSPDVKKLVEESKHQTDLQHFDEAAELAQQAIRSAGDKSGEALGYNGLSRVYYFARKLTAAVDAADQAQSAAMEAGDKALLSAALGHKGDALRDLGKLEDARSAYERQLRYLREAGDRWGEAINLRMTALLYRNMGDYERAHASAQASLNIAQTLTDRVVEGQSLFVLGFIEGQQEHYADSLKHLNAALAMPTLNSLTRSQILRMVGEIHCSQGRYRLCADMIRQQLDMAVAAGNREQIALAWYNLTKPQALMGAHQDAYESSLKALTTLRSADHDPFEEWHFLGAVGGELQALGRFRDAAPYFDEAIVSIEDLRQGLVPTEESMAKAASDPSTRELFDRAIQNRFAFDPAGAFRIAELARARAFLSILAESKVDLRKGLSDADRKREAELFARVMAIQKQTRKDAELEAAENDLETFRIGIRKTNPRLADVRYPHPLDIEQVRKSLTPGQTLIEFSLGEKRSFVWAISRGRFLSAALPPRKDIERQVAAFRQTISESVSGLTASRSEVEVKQLASRLYAVLMRPIESSLQGSKEIVVVPDGTLYYVPFEALVAPGTDTYLMERFPVRYVASATSFVETEQSPVAHASKTLLAFGDPAYRQTGMANGFDLSALPYTRDEVTGIAALFPKDQRTVYLGKAARQDSLQAETLGSYRYIHFAAHGLVDEAHPGRSGLALTAGAADDGVLRVDSITGLSINAEVVTLSACSTGLGKLASGEGMLGLVRAFLYAGAENVNVSLWNVSDAATPVLMKGFYRNLGQSIAPAEALRRAKIGMIRQENALWRHPHFWAPFVLWAK
ncbi:MAG: CHAT domain-containing tetratricopeptide repeat protein [Bryobacteraceae bacterium]